MSQCSTMPRNRRKTELSFVTTLLCARRPGLSEFLCKRGLGLSEFLCKRGFESHLRNPFLELDGKSSQRGFPIPDRHRPFLADVA